MGRSMAWTGLLAGILGFAFAVEAYAEDDTRKSEGRHAALAIIADGDGDGIPDADDNCPGVSNVDQSDLDYDSVGDVCDNCSEAANADQDDCDDDYCGNLCDCDYDQDGICGISDFGWFIVQYNVWLPPNSCSIRDHSEPIGGAIGLADFGFFVGNFGNVPGPSGTTPGTVACPL
jgi:hypothetical protein